MYEVFYYEYSESSDSATPSDSESNDIDYEKIEDAFYNALVRVDSSESNENFVYRYENLENSNLIKFATGTDSTLYTVALAQEPSSVAEQETAYVLEIRNILLIFLFIYFIISIYGKLKSTLINYFER